MIKLTKNTWHYNFYKWIFGKYEEPNSNFCDYFWLLLIAIITLPLTWVGALFNKKLYLETFWRKFWFTILTYIAIFLISIAFYISIAKSLITIGVAIIGTGIIIFIGVTEDKGYWDWLGKRKDKTINNISEIKIIGVKGFKAFKGKYCPKISW